MSEPKKPYGGYCGAGQMQGKYHAAMNKVIPVFEHIAPLPVARDVSVTTTVIRRGWYEFKEPNFWQWRCWE